MLYENQDAHSIDAQITRIKLSRKLFERNEQIETLQIIATSKSLPKWVVATATALLNQESTVI
jgi:hypothetical protein